MLRAMWLLVIGFVAAGCIQTLEADAKGKGRAPSKGWILHQRSAHIGSLVTYIGSQGAKIESNRLIVMVLAPDWKMVAFNPNNKKKYETARANWEKNYTQKHSSKAPIPLGAGGQIAGLGTEKFSADNIGGPGGDAHYYISKDIHMPKPVQDAFSKIVQMPSGLGMPLRITYKNAGTGKNVNTLDTLQVQHVAIPAATFRAPAGYTAVADEISLMLDEGSESELGDLLNDLSTDPSMQSELNKLLK